MVDTASLQPEFLCFLGPMDVSRCRHKQKAVQVTKCDLNLPLWDSRRVEFSDFSRLSSRMQPASDIKSDS